ncbi:cyclic nucleotide-binding domain-containing protein 1-like [Dendronephthya gigantea]|uniref:cyclic nucleotide-binding domain-containing protein 1-like n=1 Tax=Dendronephthya gigantea TaxID=151771 RepID=UPI00106A2331|nr:cyclic nucleotide-binding domain-containing protein 1-like [Dendronephthya gigantea]
MASALRWSKMKASYGSKSKFTFENVNTSYKLPRIIGKPEISYSALKQLCSIEGLGNRRNNSSKDAHDTFMRNYSTILKSSEEKLPALDLKPHASIGNGKLDHNPNDDVEIPHGHRPAHYCANYSYSISHNITEHLSRLHKQHLTQTRDGILHSKSHALKRLLRKLPFERTREDQEAIYHHLQYFTELTSRIPLKILRELSTVVQLEKWNDSGYTVFGLNELYLILRGSVGPCSENNVGTLSESPRVKSLPGITEDPESKIDADLEKLVAGQCFGTLHPVETENNFEPNHTRMSSVITLEPCEFVKISARDFKKMKQLVDSKITNQNLELMQSCRLFENCSKVALGKIVDLIRWKRFRPGTVLVNEGETCRVIGFISEGICNLKRSVDVAKTNRDGTKNRSQKQVIIGTLAPGDSFGECTVLRKQPITYSVVTATHVHLGVISQHDFNDVDEVTKSLLTQCYEALDHNLNEEDLQKQYIKQQKQQEWQKFKRSVVEEVILHSSILPGYGKWSRNPTIDDVVNLG